MAIMDGVLHAVRAVSSTLITHGEEHAAMKAAIEHLAAEIAKSQEPRVEVKYMSPAQAAARYGVCKDTIKEIYDMPEAPGVLKVGKQRVLIPIREFDAFLAEQFPYEKEVRA